MKFTTTLLLASTANAAENCDFSNASAAVNTLFNRCKWNADNKLSPHGAKGCFYGTDNPAAKECFNNDWGKANPAYQMAERAFAAASKSQNSGWDDNMDRDFVMKYAA